MERSRRKGGIDTHNATIMRFVLNKQTRGCFLLYAEETVLTCLWGKRRADTWNQHRFRLYKSAAVTTYSRRNDVLRGWRRLVIPASLVYMFISRHPWFEDMKRLGLDPDDPITSTQPDLLHEWRLALGTGSRLWGGFLKIRSVTVRSILSRWGRGQTSNRVRR